MSNDPIVRIAYGVDTKSIEDVSQLVIVEVPQSVMSEHEDPDALADYIDNTNLASQSIVGVLDVVDSLRLILHADQQVPDAAVPEIVGSLIDAISNNFYN